MRIENVYAEISQGTKLTKKQSKDFGKEFGEILAAVSERKKGFAFTHNRIQRIVGTFLQYLGFDVAYEVPFSSGSYNPEQVRFDIVAEKGRDTIVVEVKDFLNKRDFGQVNFYTNILEANKVKAGIYLAMDILSYYALFGEAMATELEELMTREEVGVILVDKQLMFVFGNVEQLVFEEMPLYIYSDEEIK